MSDFAQAQQAHRRGDLAGAERLYHELLAQAPEHEGALQYLGLLCAQQQRYAEAVALLGRASSSQPDQPGLLTNLGEAQRRAGDLAGAQASLSRAVELAPELIEAWHNLGLVRMALAQDTEAEAAFARVLARRPEHAAARSNLAALLLRRKACAEAVAQLEQALSLGQASPGNFANLGLARQQLGDPEGARKALMTALQLKPDFAPALLGLAELELSLQQFEHARGLYRRLIETGAEPAIQVKAWLGLAEVRLAEGKTGSALDILASGLSHLPGQSELLLLRQAQLFRDLNEPALAEAAYTRVLSVAPEHVYALHGLATLLEETGRTEQARSYYEQLRALRPESDLLALHADLLIPMVLQSSAEADAVEAQLHAVLDRWLARGLRFDPADLAFFTGQSLFMFTYHTRGDGLALRRKCAALFSPHLPRCAPRSVSEGKPHLGFIVTRGHEGIFAPSLMPLIDGLSRDKYRISLFCDRLGYQRSVASYVKQGALSHVHLPTDPAAAAAIIADAGCDLAHFWENGTDSLNFLLPFYRLAPVQMHWGWPLSSGNPEMDWYVGSLPSNPPGSEASFSERLSNMPLIPLACARRPTLPEVLKSKADFGFGPEQTLYFCAQNLLKLHPDYDSAILAILRGDPGGRFLLPRHPKAAVTAALQQRLARSCAEVYDRIVWLERLAYAEYLNLIAVVDLLLDPWPYVGSTTSIEAIGVGTPVITLPYPHSRGRYTAGLFRLLGLEAGIAVDEADYVAKALHFGRDPEARAAFSQEICARREPLYELAPRLAAYEAMLDRALAEAKK